MLPPAAIPFLVGLPMDSPDANPHFPFFHRILSQAASLGNDGGRGLRDAAARTCWWLLVGAVRVRFGRAGELAGDAMDNGRVGGGDRRGSDGDASMDGWSRVHRRGRRRATRLHAQSSIDGGGADARREDDVETQEVHPGRRRASHVQAQCRDGLHGELHVGVLAAGSWARKGRG